ncbi:nht [Drosophila busckii]|uniref:Nht n=1 Tax=Drosophila busckii TaxID=30019 RepID=A0A0M4ENK7_DROBS|nr:uncharacterized protein LOC108603774 [Drosophila busckii]ALC38262.1 nht [Drosophila busckii]
MLPNNNNSKPIEVPMQSYAGQRLIIAKPLVPEQQPKVNNKYNNQESARISHFESKSIERMLLSFCAVESISLNKHNADVLIEVLLAAVECYMKHLLSSTIELCQHRTGNRLYNDPNCVVNDNMRTTMMFLNDREVTGYGNSDDDTNYGHRRRWKKLQRNRNFTACDNEIRLETTNNTALLALGARKPPTMGAAAVAAGSSAGSAAKSSSAALPQRAFTMRIKHVNVKDVMQFMEDQQRYAKSKLLYDAYINYKW